MHLHFKLFILRLAKLLGRLVFFNDNNNDKKKPVHLNKDKTNDVFKISANI